jgi:uncharacterized protein involved in type VI secretion and phage assembly
MVFIGLVADVCEQAQRQFVGRQDGSNHSRRNGAARHAVELGRLRLLCHQETASRADGNGTARAIGAGTRENDPDRSFTEHFGKRGEENIDGQRQRVRLFGLQVQVAR